MLAVLVDTADQQPLYVLQELLDFNALSRAPVDQLACCPQDQACPELGYFICFPELGLLYTMFSCIAPKDQGHIIPLCLQVWYVHIDLDCIGFVLTRPVTLA